jgi:hypothetical protein
VLEITYVRITALDCDLLGAAFTHMPVDEIRRGIEFVRKQDRRNPSHSEIGTAAAVVPRK